MPLGMAARRIAARQGERRATGGAIRAQGLALLPSGRPSTRTNGVEAGLSDMLQRMQTGRWKVFSTARNGQEFRLYHRKDAGSSRNATI